MAEQAQHAKEVASHKADETKQYGQQKAGEAHEQSQGMAQTAKEKASGAAQTTQEKSQQLKDKAVEGLSHAGEAIKGAMGKVTGNNEGGTH
ncbi:hypothetical protein KP509_27G056800 [Ceratopteris richardii]|uniref:Uncharacterized protein n=1 Tax=Ceratopteris richardii TaxID=49495 RepID=A0A8T2RGR6_CERRI|nr:hypothetical protein KP509_27G056800 [Ceratopteris richardii]